MADPSCCTTILDYPIIPKHNLFGIRRFRQKWAPAIRTAERHWHLLIPGNPPTTTSMPVTTSMLVTNRSHPPRSIAPARAEASRVSSGESPFVSAEDFDHTGILTGVDPYASSYWWFPELHASAATAGDLVAAAADHATQRTCSRQATTVRSTSAANAA